MNDDEILARWRRGEAVQAIADAAGVTRQRIAQRVLRAAARSGDDWYAMVGARQAVVDDRRRTVTDDQRRAIVVLHRAGLSQRQIAEIVEVHRKTVRLTLENAVTDA